MPQRLIFVRHGETAYNSRDHKTNRMMGWAHDHVGLSDQGRGDALAVAAKLKNYHIDYIYHSDLKRTSETAAIITQELGMTSIPTVGLRERNLGTFAELTAYEVMTTRPHDWAKFLDHYDPNWNGLAGESLRDVHIRFRSLLSQLQSRHQNQTILLITHSGYLHTVLRDHFEFFPKESFKEVGHSSLTVLEKTLSSYHLVLYDA